MSLECETCGGTPYEGHAPDCPRANRSKSRADMQPEPATEQASGEEIYRQKARAWAKARYGSSDILSKAECDAAMHAAAEGYFAALRATQAERVQNVDLGLAKLTIEQLRTRLELADARIAELEAERVQSSGSIGTDPEFRRLVARVQGWSDGRPVIQHGMQGEAARALIEFIDARRATASKAEAIPDVLLDGYSVYAEITRKLGKSHCISADAVSETLDAVVRLMRTDTAVACNAALRPAPAMPVDAGSAIQQPWEPLTRAGQVKKGDKLVFTIGDRAYKERAKLILNPGTDKEEVVYDIGRNFYFITSCVLNGWSNHKGVEVLAATTKQGTPCKAEAPESIDYRALLIKYMRYVGSEEGTTFVSRLGEDGNSGEELLSTAEVATLKQCDLETQGTP